MNDQSDSKEVRQKQRRVSIRESCRNLPVPSSNSHRIRYHVPTQGSLCPSTLNNRLVVTDWDAKTSDPRRLDKAKVKLRRTMHQIVAAIAKNSGSTMTATTTRHLCVTAHRPSGQVPPSTTTVIVLFLRSVDSIPPIRRDE